MPRPRLSRQARRGRAILAAFTVLCGIQAGGTLVTSLLDLPQAIRLYSLSTSTLGLALLCLIWNGEQWTRVVAALAFLLNGTVRLLPVVIVVVAMIAITPPEHAKAGAEVFGLAILPVVAPILAASLLLIAFGTVLLLSKSVRQFLDYQFVTGGGLVTCIKETVGTLPGFRIDPSERSLAEIIKPAIRRPVFTSTTWDAFDDDELTEVVLELVRYRNAAIGENVGLPPLPLSTGMRMVAATSLLEAEVDNGGFHQFFWNQTVPAAFEAVEGYRLIGADAHVGIVLRAIDAWLREEESQESMRPAELSRLIEQYCEARKHSTVTELDDEFYKLPSIYTQRNEYIRSHPSEFVVDYSRFT